MFVIEALNVKGWRWISGIFCERQAAEKFLASVPDELRPMQRLLEVPHTQYPLFVLEDRGFEYGGANLVRERLARAQPSGNEDHILLNVYIVQEDFSPPKPGEDCMGDIYHWHITDSSLNPPGSDFIASELQEAERRAA